MSSKLERQAREPQGVGVAVGEQRVSLLTLSGMVVGSMVSAGIFSLPATFAQATGSFGAIIARALAGVGMLMLAFVFQMLAQRRSVADEHCLPAAPNPDHVCTQGV